MMPLVIKLLSIVAFFLALGLPLNRLPEFLVFGVALFLMIFGAVRCAAWRVLLALSLVVAAAVFSRAIAPPAIDEGFNVFLFENDPGALKALPPDILDAMARELQPLVSRYQCDRAVPGCWRSSVGVPDRLHAFSADGAFDAAPGFSRRVRDIGFTHRDQLFSAAINRFPRYNFYGIYGAQNPDRQRLPVFVTHRFPKAYEDSTLCWRGTLARPSSEGTEFLRAADGERCLVLEGLAGRPVTIAYGIDPDQPFTMRLDRTWPLGLRDVAGRAAVILAVVAALALLVDVRRRERLLVPALALGGTLLWAAGWDLAGRASALLDGLSIYRGGADGIVHDGYGRDILLHAVSGDWAEALRGMEPVFYFQPGLRYILAFGKFLFGETHYFYLLVVAFVPVAVYGVLRLLLPRRWAIGLLLLFLFTPLAERVGFSHYNFIYQLHRGHAEPLGYGALLAAMAVLLPRARISLGCARGPSRWLAFAGGLLLAVAVAARPNVVPAAAIVAAGTAFVMLRRRDFGVIAALALGGSVIFSLLLHNLLFGGRFVLLSDVSTNPFNLKMTPQAYWEAFRSLLAFDFQSAAWQRMTTHLDEWNGWSDVYRLPLVAAALYVLVRRRTSLTLRVIAAAAVAQQALLLFYNASGRYSYLAWMLCFLSFVVVLREEILPAVRRRLHPEQNVVGSAGLASQTGK